MKIEITKVYSFVFTADWVNDHLSALCVCVCALSHFRHDAFSATLWAVARQAPLLMGLSMKEYWSGLVFPSPRGLPHPRVRAHVSLNSCIVGGWWILYPLDH